MCYEALTNGMAAEKPLGTLVREEMASAVTDASIATVVVLVVLLGAGVDPVLIAGAAVAAFVLGILLHQVVLVAGVGIARWRLPQGT